MIIHFHAPASPVIRYTDGMAEYYFPGTGGWAWEEGEWAGEASAQSEVVELVPPREFDPSPADATVLQGEALIYPFFEVVHKVHLGAQLGKVCVRFISEPDESGPNGPFWKERVAPYLPAIHALSAISHHHAERLDAWARQHGYTGLPARAIRHGARVPPDLHPGELHVSGPTPDNSGWRNGVVYLGTLGPEKRVPIVVQAAVKANVPLLCGVSVNTVRARTDMAAASVSAHGHSVTFATLGLEGRREALMRARMVVTASEHEAAWMAGIEGRAHGVVAVAPKGSGYIKHCNGGGILYYDGTVDGLADVIRKLHADDEFWSIEAKRQFTGLVENNQTGSSVGIRLMDWISEAVST